MALSQVPHCCACFCHSGQSEPEGRLNCGLSNFLRRITMSFKDHIRTWMPVLALLLIAPELRAQASYVTPDEAQEITFTPGLRIQTRYVHDRIDRNNDFFIRRLRLKGKGKAFDLANYYFEVKIDNAGRYNRQPRAEVENAWLNFALKPGLAIRVGFYDMVFSRNALTSDSKLLLMDRSLIKGALTKLGVADNTVGVLVFGRPLAGHLTYGAGIFDNIGFEVEGSATTLERKANGAMTTGRLVYDFLDPAPIWGYADYRGSYIGQGHRLSIGASAGYLSRARIGEREFRLVAWGADLFFNYGRWTFEAEYDQYKEEMFTSVPDIDGEGWYAQGGFLLVPNLELAARHQELDANKNVAGDKLQWTTLGFNIYLRGHQLKIQTEYTFKKEQGDPLNNNVFQVQLQLDY
ncbi:MAG: hypothetical protein D6814_00890 [Calditrichaeota bacterium]|nr:MAG: hypothetical protein D6814_00890 [Calditrichota bacterium]